MPSFSPERHERLLRTYEVLVQLVMHEGRFISERTSNFLLFNSILFGGFTLLVTSPPSEWASSLGIVLPIVGLILSFFQKILISYTVRNAADFWRSSIGLIEKDADFWVTRKSLEDADLDIFSARLRSFHGEQTRQQQMALKTGGIPSPPPKFFLKYFRSNQIYGFWLPIIIGGLWIMLLSLSLIQLGVWLPIVIVMLWTLIMLLPELWENCTCA